MLGMLFRSQCSQRRSLGWASCGALAATAWVLSFGWASSALADPSRNIEEYVLFAFESINFKGRDADPTRGFISGGHVGVDQVDPQDPPLPRLSMGGGGGHHVVVLADNTQVVTDTGRLDEDSNLWDLYINRLVGGSPPVIRNSGPTPFTAPILASPPALPVFSPGTTDVAVESNTIVSINPGSYNEIWVKDDGVLTLQPGIYNVHNIRCGRRVTITTFDGTEVRVAVDMHFNNGSYVGVGTDVRWLLRSDGLGVHDNTVTFGRNTTFYGTVYAPNGQINLGHTTDLFGRFWANSIGSDFNVNINTPPGGSTAALPTTWSGFKAIYR
jgi:hypothetical protein